MLRQGMTSTLVALAVSLAITSGAQAKTPAVSILDASGREGDSLKFQVKAKPKAKKTIKLTYATVARTATAEDFSPGDGTAKIKAGKSSTTIAVATLEDTVHEETETFGVELTAAKNANLRHASATGTIDDDDDVALPSVSVGNASLAELNPGQTPVGGLLVSLSEPSASLVSVNWAVTAGGSASAGDTSPASGSVQIPAGMTSSLLPLAPVPDFDSEGDETALVTLSEPVNATLGDATGQLTVQDDDPATGSLVINEYMANPNDVTDVSGEWIEILNTGVKTANLFGLKIFTGGTERCTLSGAAAPNGLRVATTDPDVPGSTCAALLILNSASSITLKSDGIDLDTLSYSTTTAGRSASLDPNFASTAGNDITSNFCLGVGLYRPGGGTDQGTPGVANPPCP